MFSKLMPKEARFFDLFNAHADLIVIAAIAWWIGRSVL
jgi:hypothetical protein